MEEPQLHGSTTTFLGAELENHPPLTDSGFSIHQSSDLCQKHVVVRACHQR